MSRYSIALIVSAAVLALLGSSSSSGVLEALTQDKQAFLDGHNEARRAEGVGMQDLVWDDDLASMVEGLATGCEFNTARNLIRARTSWQLQAPPSPTRTWPAKLSVCG
ncbi:hypothetical protein RRG08_029937 [Elysia crispata]|uniref:SCP domain-containing protein n=1 Tax=Elysia crispata TaxID=231223 RepID=A0AAE1DH17_9GAST|nr:hypothetical protein RRG08_029937 [Elysia crispata]